MAMVITQNGTRSAERGDIEPLVAAVEALSDAQAQRILAEEALRLPADKAEEQRGQT
jgi:hypothetical protein